MCYIPVMKTRARHAALVEFLLPYQDIWRNEIMLQYPRSQEAYDPAWVDELRGHESPGCTFALMQGEGWTTLMAPGLADFHHHLLSLTQFPTLTPGPFPTQSQSWVHIKPKKQHELEALAPLIDRRVQEHGLKRVVDIGGGQGHLAQTVAQHYERRVLSLDMDPALQDIGRRWQTAKWGDSPHAVEFRHHQITRPDQTFAALLSNDTLTTGLHTCGGLAVAHLEAAALARAHVMNLGCCYHKLGEDEYNLSTGPALAWNQFALTLASGAHRKFTLADVAFRQRMKRMRYTLHFLLREEFGMAENVTLGNSAPELYNGPFAPYCREQLGRLGLATAHTDQALDALFASTTNQRLISDMLAAGIVRDVLGRPLEAVILLDRALWLEEQGLAVELTEVFDPTRSPRNLLLTASPTN